jgi:DNA-binding CsgD family transcriptional regulator
MALELQSVFKQDGFPLVGRESELAQLTRLLGDDSIRFINAVGATGVGKTRLVFEVLRHADCLKLASTAVVVGPPLPTDRGRLMPSLLDRLGTTGSEPDNAVAQLTQIIGVKPLLVVLAGSGEPPSDLDEVCRLLMEVPPVRLLMTSRTPMEIDGEYVVEICPLVSDDARASGSDRPSTFRLAELAALRANPEFDIDAHANDLVRLCSAVDGIPQAILIAASALALADGDVDLEELELGAGDDAEESSFRRALTFSHAHMSPVEAWIFPWLGLVRGHGSVAMLNEFSGPWSRPELAAGVDLLHRKCVIEGAPDAAERFAVAGSVHAFARALLVERGQFDVGAQHLVELCMNLASTAAAGLHGPAQRTWYDVLNWNLENVALVMDWLVANRLYDSGLGLCTSLGEFWWTRGYSREAIGWFEACLGGATDVDPDLRLHALLAAGKMCSFIGRDDQGLEYLRAGLALARRREDRVNTCRGLTYLGWQEIVTGDGAGLELLSEATWMSHALGAHLSRPLTIELQIYTGAANIALGNPDRGAVSLEAALRGAERAGDERTTGAVHVFLAAAHLAGRDAQFVIPNLLKAIATCVDFQDGYLMSHCLELSFALLSPHLAPNVLATVVGAKDAMSRSVTGTTHLKDVLPGLIPPPTRANLLRAHRDEYLAGRAMSVAEAALLVRPLLENEMPNLNTDDAQLGRLLTLREGKILKLMAEGSTDEEIVQRLGISRRTLRRVNATLMTKLGATNRPHAVALAGQRGFLPER